MVDYRLPYLGATLALAVSALAKTLTYLLLRYFADNVLTQGKYIAEHDADLSLDWRWDLWVWRSFEGGFSFLSGRLAAYTAEGITRRLRDFLFDHIQRLSFSYHATTPTGDLIERVTSDVDALRRFFSEQAIGMGRIILLFVINFIAILNLNVRAGAGLGRRDPVHAAGVALVLQAGDQSAMKTIRHRKRSSPPPCRRT